MQDAGRQQQDLCGSAGDPEGAELAVAARGHVPGQLVHALLDVLVVLRRGVARAQLSKTETDGPMTESACFLMVGDSSMI